MVRLYRLIRTLCFLAPCLLTLAVSLMPKNGTACTTVVISGKATVDGRPLLWKNRDTWQRHNELLYDVAGKYRFVGVANAGAVERIRMGCNTVGLCIENSVSRDLAPDVESGLSNGELIRLGLQTCVTVDDFRSLLDRTNKIGRTTRGNFGVIDASGGAMMFEVGPDSYKAFDANDPNDAPQGFIVRANFSETAMSRQPAGQSDRESAYSIERFERASDLCSDQLRSGPLDFRYLLNVVARDADGCRANGFLPGGPITPTQIVEQVETAKTLNRRNTVSAVVFRGVLPDESPQLTTMWTLLGEPLFAIAFPAWASQGGVAEQTNGPSTSELCELSIRLRERHYDAGGSKLLTQRLLRTTGQLSEVEDELIASVEQRLARWRSTAPDPNEMRALHHHCAARATEALATVLAGVPAAKRKIDASPVGIDFRFEDTDGTTLGDVFNSVGDASFNGGLSDCQVTGGVLRIRRNKTSATNRYVKIQPRIKTRGSGITYQGFLVAEVRGWNLRGRTLGEQVRFGFSSQGEKNYQTAAMVLERTGDEEVSLSGIAFGNGSVPIETKARFPARQTKPVTFVLEVDKTRGNPGEGDTGGQFRVYYRIQGDHEYRSIGSPGSLRRMRNGNEVHLRSAGLFAARDEFFDIDRLYFTTKRPFSEAEIASPSE